MMKISKTKILEIAEWLLCGEKCFINKLDGSVINIPHDMDDFYRDEENPWQDEMDKIDQNFENYIKCEPMESHQTFEVMKEFIGLVKSDILIEKLIPALNSPKPFRNFKYLIETSEEYRQKWFDFRLEQNMLWVREQISEMKHN